MLATAAQRSGLTLADLLHLLIILHGVEKRASSSSDDRRSGVFGVFGGVGGRIAMKNERVGVRTAKRLQRMGRAVLWVSGRRCVAGKAGLRVWSICMLCSKQYIPGRIRLSQTSHDASLARFHIIPHVHDPSFMAPEIQLKGRLT